MTTIQLAEAPPTSKDIQTTLLPPQKRCRLIQHNMKAGATFERHRSDAAATIQTISGQGLLCSESRELELRPGTLASLEPGEAYTVSAGSDLVLVVSEYLGANIPC